MQNFMILKLEKQTTSRLYGGENGTPSRKNKYVDSGPEQVQTATGSVSCSDEIIAEYDDDGRLIETCENWTCL